jgi:enoyl-CoA hydratase/carnithine racemase
MIMGSGLVVDLKGAVATFTIDREHRRNALDDPTLLQLRDALQQARPPDVKVIILKGQGSKAFSAGSDIKEMAEQGPDQRLAHTELGQQIAEMIEQHPCPVIAAIEGYCLGGGLEMAVACDYRIAGRGATLGLPEIRINALPSWGGTVRVPRLIGVARARELIMFGRMLDAETALAWGLVAELVAEGEAAKRAADLASEIAAKRDPRCMALAKRLLTNGWALPTRGGNYLEYLADMNQLSSDALGESVGKFAAGKKPS